MLSNYAGVRMDVVGATLQRFESFSSDSNFDVVVRCTFASSLLSSSTRLCRNKLLPDAVRSALLCAVSANTLNVLRLPPSLTDDSACADCL